MSKCISVPIDIGGSLMYKDIYTGEVSTEPKFTNDEVELSIKYAQVQAQLVKAEAKLDASIQSNSMLEECLVEVADIVYA